MKKIWYKAPALDAESSFPVGNGRLGGLVFGNISHEIIKLNEESVWSKCYSDRNNPNSSKSIKHIRTLISQGRKSEAQEIAYECMSSLPSEQSYYKSAGEIHIDFYDAETFGLNGPFGVRDDVFKNHDSYRRVLDFETGIASSSFAVESESNTTDFSEKTNGSSVSYARECFVSSSSNVLVYHMSSSTPKGIFFRAQIHDDESTKKYSLADDTVVSLNTQGIPYATIMTASVSGGTVRVLGESLIVEKADDVTLYVDVETAFRSNHFRKKGGNVSKSLLTQAYKCVDMALKRVCFASGTTYENLRAEHINEFAAWNEGTSLFVDGNSELEKLSMEELSGNKSALMEIAFNYGRYKLISSNKDKTCLPSLENGLWLYDSSKKTRFRLDKNGIASEAAGMFGFERFSLPLAKFLKMMFWHGINTSAIMYDAEGFVCHGSTDLFGDTSPNGTDLRSSYIPLGALCISNAIIDYYEYSLDIKFLKKNFYILKSACDFFASYLVFVDEKTNLVLSPAFTEGKESRDGKMSYISDFDSRTQVQIKKIFENTLKAMKYLEIIDKKEHAATKYSSVVSRLKVSENENDLKDDDNQTNPENFDAFLKNTVESIVSSRYEYGGTIAIKLLSSVPDCWKSGSLKKVCLKGKIFADVSWKDGKFENACLYTEHGVKFVQNVSIEYEGKTYCSNLSNGSLDIKNVLPSTI